MRLFDYRLTGSFEVNSSRVQAIAAVVSDYGIYDASTLLKDVTAVVNVTFALG